MEAAMVFNKYGEVFYWHLPPDRSAGAIPDSRDLWDVLWNNRDRLGGVAHSHPWNGMPDPSPVDLTTFAAIETGLGQRLIWPISTFTVTRYFIWEGPDRLWYSDMKQRRFRLRWEDINRLRELSR